MALTLRQTGSSLSRLLFGTPSISSGSVGGLPLPLHTSLVSSALPSISIPIPGFLVDLWEGILRAVPKKKTSHSKRRHRQLAGKALKDVKSINSCAGCGRPKKAHHLCPFCVAEIKAMWAPSRYIAPTKKKSTNFFDPATIVQRTRTTSAAVATMTSTETAAATSTPKKTRTRVRKPKSNTEIEQT